MAKNLIMNLLLTVGFVGFIIYLKFAMQSKPKNEYNDLYMDILNSDKYKVKGKFE